MFNIPVVVFVSFLIGCLRGQVMLDVSLSPNCHNPCLDNPCENNSTCVQGIACKPLCLCSSDYFGDICQHEIEDFKDVNKSDLMKQSGNIFTLNKDTCRDVGLFCEDGLCIMFEDAKFKCDCFKGWFGVHCNISSEQLSTTPPSTTDTLPFFKLSTTSSVTSTSSSTTTSPSSSPSNSNSSGLTFLFEAWNNLKPVPEIPDEVDDVEPVSKVENTTLDPRYNVCSASPAPRPILDRKCPMQFEDQPCEYGVCKQELVDHGTWMGHSFTCVCDIGARGTYTDKPLSMPSKCTTVFLLLYIMRFCSS